MFIKVVSRATRLEKHFEMALTPGTLFDLFCQRDNNVPNFAGSNIHLLKSNIQYIAFTEADGVDYEGLSFCG